MSMHIFRTSLIFLGLLSLVGVYAPSVHADNINWDQPLCGTDWRVNHGPTNEWKGQVLDNGVLREEKTKRIRTVSVSDAAMAAYGPTFTVGSWNIDNFQQMMWKAEITGSGHTEIDCSTVIYEFTDGPKQVTKLWFAAHDRLDSQNLAIRYRESNTGDWHLINTIEPIPTITNITSQDCVGANGEDSPRDEDDECFQVYSFDVNQTVEAFNFGVYFNNNGGGTGGSLNDPPPAGPGGRNLDVGIRFLGVEPLTTPPPPPDCIVPTKACSQDGTQAMVQWNAWQGASDYLLRFDSAQPSWFSSPPAPAVGLMQPNDIRAFVGNRLSVLIPLSVSAPNRINIQGYQNGIPLGEAGCWYDFNCDVPPSSISCENLPAVSKNNGYVSARNTSGSSSNGLARVEHFTDTYKVINGDIVLLPPEGTVTPAVTQLSGVPNVLESVSTDWWLPLKLGLFGYQAVYTDTSGQKKLCYQVQDVTSPVCEGTTLVPTQVPWDAATSKPSVATVATSCKPTQKNNYYLLEYPADYNNTPTPKWTQPTIIEGVDYGVMSELFNIQTIIDPTPSVLEDKQFSVTCRPCLTNDPATCASPAPACDAAFTVGCSCGAVSSVAVTPEKFDENDRMKLTWGKVVLPGNNPDQHFIVKVESVDAAGENPEFISEYILQANEVVVSPGSYKYEFSSAQMLTFRNALSNTIRNKLKFTVTPDCGCPGGPSEDEAEAFTTIPLTETHNFFVVDSSVQSCSGKSAQEISGLSGTLATIPVGVGSNSDPANGFSFSIPNQQLGSEFGAVFSGLSSSFECACGSTSISPGGVSACKTNLSTDIDHVVYVKSAVSIDSWWSAVGGFVFGKNKVQSEIPEGANNLCQGNIQCDTFFVRSFNYLQDSAAGFAITQNNSANIPAGYLSERETGQESMLAKSTGGGSRPFSTILPIPLLEGSIYEYYKALIPAFSQEIPNATTWSVLPEISSSGTEYISINGDLTLEPSLPDSLKVLSDEKYVVFVSGNLIVKDSNNVNTVTSVDEGGFLAFFVKGSITVDATVGTPIDSGAVASPELLGIGPDNAGEVPVANLKGMFIADGLISIISNDAASPDKRFIGEGSFIAQGEINLFRSYSRPTLLNTFSWSGYAPTEVFRHDPSMVLATPAELRSVIQEYQEVR